MTARPQHNLLPASADIMSASSVVCRYSIAFILKRTDVGQDGDDLAFDDGVLHGERRARKTRREFLGIDKPRVPHRFAGPQVESDQARPSTVPTWTLAFASARAAIVGRVGLLSDMFLVEFSLTLNPSCERLIDTSRLQATLGLHIGGVDRGARRHE